MTPREMAREAVSPTAWFIAAAVALIGFCVTLALAGPLSRL